MANSTRSVSFEQASKQSTMTRLKFGISATGQRYIAQNKGKKLLTTQNNICNEWRTNSEPVLGHI